MTQSFLRGNGMLIGCGFKKVKKKLDLDWNLIYDAYMYDNSDKASKNAFVDELRKRGHTDVQIEKSPDIISKYDGHTYYWEVKYTARKDRKCFGACTTTEWELALDHECYFTFVIAMEYPNGWRFHEYTPAQWMELSTVPPPKINFAVHVGREKSMDTHNHRRGQTGAVTATRNILRGLMKHHKLLKSGNPPNF